MEAAIKNVIIDAWPSLAVLLSIIIMRITRLVKGEGDRWPIHMEIFNLFFIAYLLLLFRLVTSQDLTAIHSTNFMPFREILRYEIGSNAFYKQVIGNIVLFIPFGFFVSYYLNNKKTLVALLSAFIVSGCAESLQYYIGRVFDIDDIILNVLGAFVGYLLYVCLNAIKGRLPRFMRSDAFINFLVIVIIIVIILFSLKINIFNYL